MAGIKNMDMAKVLVLKDEVAYQPGQVVSKTLAQNENLSVTLFAFDKGEEISTHDQAVMPLLLVLMALAKSQLMVLIMNFMKGSLSLCLQNTLMQYLEKSSLKCC